MVPRAARKGEIAFSSNGTPLAPDTIAQAPEGALTITVQPGEEQPIAYVSIGGEPVVRLDRVDALSDQGRAQLEVVQAMVDDLLRRHHKLIN